MALEQLTPGDRSSSIYPTPFFDISSTYQPPTLQELFKWTRYFYLTDPTISSVVNKMSYYPVTRLIYESDEEHSRVYENILEHNLDINTKLIQIGVDYYVFGNCYLTFRQPVTRLGTCQKCNNKQEISEYKKIQTRFGKRVGLTWTAYCTKCHIRGTIKVEDFNVKESNKFTLIFWDPLNIEVEVSPVSNNSKYIYNIPEKIKKEITENNQDALYSTPFSFLKATLDPESAGRVVLSKSSLFHFKRPGITQDDTNRGYGTPLVLPAIRLIHYMSILRKHQEAIAYEHIVPMRVLTPAAAQGMNPYQHVNLPAWQGQVQEQVKRWRQDPNEFLITSVPLKLINVSGDARGLFVTPELQFVRRQIISSMDVPIEFIDGGLQWSGSSVSIRILENQFISYRSRLQRFIDWLIVQIANIKGMEKITIRMADFKAADDSARRKLLFDLNQSGKLSNKGLFDDLGIDYDEESKLIHTENINNTKNQSEIMQIQSEAEAKVQVSQQIAGMELQKEIQKKFTPDPELIEKVIKLLGVLAPEAIKSILMNIQMNNEGLYTAVYQGLFPQKEQPKPRGKARATPSKPKQQSKQEKPLPVSKPPRGKDKTI